jgi:two-component system, NtrC family, response regulator HupR/HoxA
MSNFNFEKLHAVKKLKKILEQWWGLQINFLDPKGQVVNVPKGCLFTASNKSCKTITADDSFLISCVRSVKKECSKASSNCHAGFSTLSIPIKDKEKNLGYIFCDGFILQKTKTKQLEQIKKTLKKLPTSPKDISSYLKDIPVISEENLNMIRMILTDMTEEIISYNEEQQQSQEKISDLEQALEQRFEFSNIIGKSKAMQEIFQMVDQVKNSTATVLVLGEHGTGKELIARALHYRSQRKDEPFIALNCGALNESVLESELFGHSQGAFTGAAKERKGFFEYAKKGTLFLDEVGDMPLSMQVKLLRVLQNKTFIPVGSSQEKKTQARIICATNKDLEKLCKQEKFREDLFYRLNVININVPSLKKRVEDIPLLIEFFMNKNAEISAGKTKALHKKSLYYLLNYSWPGNIRELENEIERLYILSGDSKIISDKLVSKKITKKTK